MKFTWFNVNLMENNTNNLQLNVCKVMQSLDLKWTLEAVQVGEEETTSLQLFEYSHITKSSIDPDLGKQWTATEGLEHTSDLDRHLTMKFNFMKCAIMQFGPSTWNKAFNYIMKGTPREIVDHHQLNSVTILTTQKNYTG